MRVSSGCVNIDSFVRRLKRALKKELLPSVSRVAKRRDPFKVLIACLISLRTKDDVTAESARRLFSAAETPGEIVRLSESKIARLIYPAGFYRSKAKTIRRVCRDLLEKHGGVVPADLDSLLSLKGVGRKTANLVVTKGFGKPGICVDTHVHRIVNRWGYVSTRKPDDTEAALRGKLPQRYWILLNDLLVTFGKKICTPVSPKCSQCPLDGDCPKINVASTR